MKIWNAIFARYTQNVISGAGIFSASNHNVNKGENSMSKKRMIMLLPKNCNRFLTV